MLSPDTLHQLQKKIKELHCCIIIPTYNNEQTLQQVITDVMVFTDDIIIVNDGSTDATPVILNQFLELQIISYTPNKGKGIALRAGFQHAEKLGYRYAITIDSDGQHFAKDIPRFCIAIQKRPNSLIIGARNLKEKNMPAKNTFANNFSNFWVLVETGLQLPDTQSGFRLYPLAYLKDMRFFSSKYEFELEILVKAAWKGIPVHSINVHVCYPENKVSHFRPGKDFIRISILNIYLVLRALLWQRPVQIISKFTPDNIAAFIKTQVIHSNESIARKAIAVGFGVFMGIIPIWGYQLMTALILAHFFKLNKTIVGVAANISIPPMIPFILYGSLKTGQFILRSDLQSNVMNTKITFETIKRHLLEYVVGSCLFAIVMATLFGGITYLLLQWKQSKTKSES